MPAKPADNTIQFLISTVINTEGLPNGMTKIDTGVFTLAGKRLAVRTQIRISWCGYTSAIESKNSHPNVFNGRMPVTTLSENTADQFYINMSRQSRSSLVG